MRTPIVDGRSIDQFIPANLRGMFYRNAIPQYKYAIHDGYSPYGFTTKGLVLYLPLWALKESSFKSVDAYKHTCTVTNALWVPDGRTFAGSDYITIPDANSLDLGTGSFTHSGWIKTSDATNAQAIYGDYSADLGTLFYVYQNGVNFWSYASGADFTSSSWVGLGVTDGAWHHLAVVRITGDKYYLYVDGAATGIPDTDDTTGTLSNANLKYVGQRPGSLYRFNGSIGEVWIHTRALSTAEIAHNYNSTKWRY